MVSNSKMSIFEIQKSVFCTLSLFFSKLKTKTLGKISQFWTDQSWLMTRLTLTFPVFLSLKLAFLGVRALELTRFRFFHVSQKFKNIESLLIALSNFEVENFRNSIENFGCSIESFACMLTSFSQVFQKFQNFLDWVSLSLFFWTEDKNFG